MCPSPSLLSRATSPWLPGRLKRRRREPLRVNQVLVPVLRTICLFRPPPLWLEVLQSFHASKLTCHPGILRTQQAIHQCFWWPTLREGTQELITESAQLVLLHVVHLHGLPSNVVGPGTPVYINILEWFGKLLGDTTRLSSRFHPQTNGQTKCINQEMETAL